jgi:valyl-tRNA synthetase
VAKELGDVDRQARNEGFVSQAKPEVVERERERRSRLELEHGKLLESLKLAGATGSTRQRRCA